ncbi:MAG: response regulator transcription factor [Candidatus Spyradocola sp.]|jgi:two-component system response regulator YesN
MAQYKILLVDDEVDVRESIARTVDWEACGFSLCGCAAGALEALEMAKTLVPDVVMTDICMPYMDGLELIERLQQMYPAMRFVVVSGHDDFAYAQRALKFRVMDYLLKPLSLSGVREALGRIRASLDEAFARRLDTAAFLEQQNQDRVQIERLRLLEMLFENTNESLGLLREPADDQAFPAHLALMAVGRTPENEEVLRRDFAGRMDLLRFSLQEIAQERLEELSAGSCVCHRGRFVLLLRCEQEQAVALLSEVMDTVRMYLKLTTKAVLTTPAKGPGDLPALYQRALFLLENNAAAPDGLFLLAEEAPPSAEGTLAAGLPGEVAQLLRAGDAARIEAYFTRMREDLSRRADPSLLLALSSMVHTAILTTALRAGISAEEVLPVLEAHRLAPPLEVASVLRALCEAVQEAARRIAERSRVDSQAFAQRIAAYIGEHYAEATLSISDVCDAFRISQTQLSLLFKREMGTSFLQYVLDMRIDRAKALLRSSEKKIYEIALETGFEDPGYFSYCFKQRCGVTPKNYRQGADARAQN